jgi:hypothetical protein
MRALKRDENQSHGQRRINSKIQQARLKKRRTFYKARHWKKIDESGVKDGINSRNPRKRKSSDEKKIRETRRRDQRIPQADLTRGKRKILWREQQ